MSLPAARLGDLHHCPVHGPSPIAAPCCDRVLIGNQPAARRGDFAACVAGPDSITQGSRTVLIGGQSAARLSDKCAHGGAVMLGMPTVLIGDPPVGPDGRVFQIPPECAFLKDFGNQATGGKLDRLRDHYASTAPTPVDVTIPGDAGPTRMLKRDVWIRGHKVTVYEPPGGAPAGKWLPDGDGVTKSLATLSDEQLRNTKEVYIVPHDGPLTAGGSHPVADYHDGKVRYFPRGEAHPQSDVDWAFQHETGHAYSLNEVWKRDPAAREAWKKAIADDRRSVSAYGNTNEVEDFAEFTLLYADVAGTPCEASARAMFPNRFREMDKLFPRGIAQRNPAGAGAAY
jgi:uncharacterized Zn-binding protein involved in type VI secretion